MSFNVLVLYYHIIIILLCNAILSAIPLITANIIEWGCHSFYDIVFFCIELSCCLIYLLRRNGLLVFPQTELN